MVFLQLRWGIWRWQCQKISWWYWRNEVDLRCCTFISTGKRRERLKKIDHIKSLAECCGWNNSFLVLVISRLCRSQWPRGLRRGSAAARLLGLWVRIPPGAWKFVCCECCVLSGRGLCDGLITRPEESYQLWCIVVCDLETSWMRRPWPALGRSATKKNLTSIH